MEIVFNSHDYATLLADAESLGFTQTDSEGNVTIITNGTFESGGGWFLNIVGPVFDNQDPPVQREGYWGRLRLNGQPQEMPSFSSAITQYVFQQGDMESPGKWVDAATGADAPDWVGSIGMIA